MTDEIDPDRCQYVCPRKQRQCKMMPSNSASNHCMEHLLFDPNLDEVTTPFIHIRTRSCLSAPGDQTIPAYPMPTQSSAFDLATRSETAHAQVQPTTNHSRPLPPTTL